MDAPLWLKDWGTIIGALCGLIGLLSVIFGHVRSWVEKGVAEERKRTERVQKEADDYKTQTAERLAQMAETIKDLRAQLAWERSDKADTRARLDLVLDELRDQRGPRRPASRPPAPEHE